MCNEFEIRNKCTNDEYYVVLSILTLNVFKRCCDFVQEFQKSLVIFFFNLKMILKVY